MIPERFRCRALGCGRGDLRASRVEASWLLAGHAYEVRTCLSCGSTQSFREPDVDAGGHRVVLERSLGSEGNPWGHPSERLLPEDMESPAGWATLPDALEDLTIETEPGVFVATEAVGALLTRWRTEIVRGFTMWSKSERIVLAEVSRSGLWVVRPPVEEKRNR